MPQYIGISCRHGLQTLIRYLYVLILLGTLCGHVWASTPITLKVPSLPDPAADNVPAIANRAVIDAFYDTHPNIKLEQFSGISIQGMADDSRTLMAIAGKIGPDILYLNFRTSDTFISQGFLYPLDEFLTPETLENIPPAVLPVIQRYGHTWAMPYDICTVALMYRKDAFKAAGLDPEKPPQTWAELLHYSQRLRERDMYAFRFGEGPQSAWDFMAFLWSAGGDAVQEVDGEWRAVFNGPEATEAMRYFLQLRELSITGPRAGRLWEQGKVGMMFAYLNEGTLREDIDTGVIGFAPVPAGPAGAKAEINCRMWGIYSGCSPEKRVAAWKYISFMTGKQAERVREAVYAEHDFRLLEDPALRATYEYALEHGKPEPYGKNCQMVYTHMTRAMMRCERDPDNIGAILNAEVARTNAEMLKIISPEVRQFRNRIALFVGIGIMAIFLIVIVKVWRIFSRDSAESGRRTRWPFYAILFPALASILLWRYVPLAAGSILALQDYRIAGGTTFTGMDNLADVLWDRAWWASLVRTLYYMTLALGLGFWPPIALGILLSEVRRGRFAYRLVYYLPSVLSGIVVIYLWRMIFDPTGWLTDARMAMLCCILPGVWAGAGPGCLIYLAALKTVPESLYDAAAIDGCGFWGKIWHVAIPSIKGLIIIQFIGAFIGASQSAGFILVMTFGGPGESTKVAGLHIFEKAYIFLRFGTAVTMAWMLGVLLLGFTVLQLKRLSKMEFRANV